MIGAEESRQCAGGRHAWTPRSTANGSVCSRAGSSNRRYEATRDALHQLWFWPGGWILRPVRRRVVGGTSRVLAIVRQPAPLLQAERTPLKLPSRAAAASGTPSGANPARLVPIRWRWPALPFRRPRSARSYPPWRPLFEDDPASTTAQALPVAGGGPGAPRSVGSSREPPVAAAPQAPGHRAGSRPGGRDPPGGAGAGRTAGTGPGRSRRRVGPWSPTQSP